MQKLRVGLIGLGGIGSGTHLPALLKIPEVEIVAVCDIREDRAQKYASSLGVKKYTDFKQMIDNEKLDFVDICTPNYLHSQMAVYALEKGVNAFCEKPDAVSVEEVIKMQEAEAKSGKRLMVMRNNRYAYATEQLKKKIDNGEVGDIYAGRCGWIRRRGIPGRGGWFTTKAQSGGGPLIDLGVHMIDLAVYLMGNPRVVAVSGCTYNKFANSEDTSDSVHSKFGDKVEGGIFDVEDLAIGFIKFDNGASLQIEFSWASNIKMESNFVELRGSKAGFKWSGLDYEFFTGAPVNPIASFFKRLGVLSKHKNGHYENLKHFVDVLNQKAEPMYKIEQGINMIKILEGIYESAQTGKEVRFD